MECEPTVFVVDPDEATRRFVEQVVANMNLPCEAFTTGRDFLEAEVLDRPGCLVLEVRIPGVNGLQIQQHAKRQRSLLPVVFLASDATISIAVRAMRDGAVNFLEKPVREHELWDTVQEAVKLSARRQAIGMRHQHCKDRLARLTDKELQVLTLIAEGRSRKYIASALNVCVRTVELRSTSLMRKLEIDSMAELVHFAVLAMDGDAGGIGVRTASNLDFQRDLA
jgi:FixJ family two-component response regulator